MFANLDLTFNNLDKRLQLLIQRSAWNLFDFDEDPDPDTGSALEKNGSGSRSFL